MAAGKFREDLFYRLNVITLRVPPLRERPEDIPLLVEHFVTKHGAERAVKVTRAAMAKLIGFPWPGNVRQLENEVRRALVLGRRGHRRGRALGRRRARRAQRGARSGARHAHPRRRASRPSSSSEALQKTRGNQTTAAQLLGLSRFGLQKMMKRLGIKVADVELTTCGELGHGPDEAFAPNAERPGTWSCRRRLFQ